MGILEYHSKGSILTLKIVSFWASLNTPGETARSIQNLSYCLEVIASTAPLINTAGGGRHTGRRREVGQVELCSSRSTASIESSSPSTWKLFSALTQELVQQRIGPLRSCSFLWWKGMNVPFLQVCEGNSLLTHKITRHCGILGTTKNWAVTDHTDHSHS